MADEAKTPNWWQTLPGILTALAGLITAATGAIIAINQFKGPATTVVSTSPPAAPAVVSPVAVAPPAAASPSTPLAAASAAVPPQPADSDAIKAELRNIIRDIRNGAPNFQQMYPGVAEVVHQRLSNIRSHLDALGPLRKITFDDQQNGAYVYDVKFANGSSKWRIKFDAGGRIKALGWAFGQGGNTAADHAANNG